MEAPAHQDSAPHSLWDAAIPASEALYQVTDRPRLREDVELRERLRRAMASAMSCINDAVRDTESRMACAYLAGAERMVQSVLEYLCRAYEGDRISDDEYTMLFGRCGVLCRRLEEALGAMPEGSRDTVVINNYAELHLSRP